MNGNIAITDYDWYRRLRAVPDLEAAHIKPYAAGGPHAVSNGVLLRADFHRLFDQGYLTVTPDRVLEVSRRLREDYANGRTYYPFHGQPIACPTDPLNNPSADFLRWHNDNVYLA